MKLKLIACKVLFRELSRLAAESENQIDVTWLRQGYHNVPEKLRALLQAEIDAVESGEDPHSNDLREEDFDAILIGYGLCSNAAAGLTARRHRLVIPRAHDCITLFLGGKERYAELFETIPGCFWYTQSWIECAAMPCRAGQERQRREFEAQGYDEETIDYLLEELGGLEHYSSAAYIRMPGERGEDGPAFTKEAADYFGWQYHELTGSPRLLEKLVAGDWNEEDFLVLEPGETAEQSADARIIRKTGNR